MAESALLDVCLRLTCGGVTPLRFDGRNMAQRFSATNYKKIYRTAKCLETKGWLIKTGGGFRIKSKVGLYTHTLYTVLTHDAWAQKHKKQCRTVDTSGNGTVDTSVNGDASTVDKTPISPWTPVTHSFVKASVLRKSPKALFSTGQEIIRASDGVCPAVDTSGNGAYSVPIPDYAEFVAREGWQARRDLGRGTTTAEIAEIQRLNRERIKPQATQ
jgi:hypothetical protein